MLDMTPGTPLYHSYSLVEGSSMCRRKLRVRRQMGVEGRPVNPLPHLVSVNLRPWLSVKPGTHVLAEVLSTRVVEVKLSNGLARASKTWNGATLLGILFLIVRGITFV
jgi:hypothetical protein